MSTVDERVVSFKFENNDFEERVKGTIDSLEKLNKSIDFTNHTKGGKGFDEITKVVNSTHFEGMERGIEQVSKRFSNLGIIGVTALTNITNSAVNAGKNLIKSLTIKPVKMGLDEYELKMGSMRTILASTRKEFKNEGEAIQSINKYLNELNEYSDKTIYSFSDMTNNIGKFTNAGVKLDVAVQAIKGVSNAAALSGASAQEASRAMYNFSQALSAGYVKLIDWKSIENANMATKEFKEQLIQTALALGTIRKKGKQYVTVTTNAKGAVSSLFDATSNFNDSLSYQWMTTDVLTTTLNNYATDVGDMSEKEKKAYESKLKAIGYTEKQIAAIEETGKKAYEAASEITTWSKLVDTLQESVQSGWAQTFELLFGNIKEATALWTGIGKALSSVIDATSDARNGLLKEWKDAGGREGILNGIANTLKYIGSLLKPVGEAFRELFPPASGKALAILSMRFEEFTKKLKASDTLITNIRDTFRGLFSVLALLKDIIVGVINVVLPATESATSFAEILFTITGAIGRAVYTVVDFIRNIGVLDAIFGTARTVIKKFVSVLNSVAKKIASMSTSVSKFINNYLAKALSYLTQFVRFLTNNFSYAINRASHILNATFIPAVNNLRDKIKDSYTSIVAYIKENEKISAIGRIYRKASEEAGAHVDALRTKVKKVTVGKDFTSGFIKVGNTIKTTLVRAFNAIPLDKVKTAFAELWQSVKGLGSEIASTLAPMFSKVGEFLKNLNIIDNISKGVSFLADKIKTFTDAIKDGIHPMEQLKTWLDPRNFIDVANATEKASRAYKTFGGTVEDLNNTGTSSGSRGTFADRIKKGIASLVEQFKDNTLVQAILNYKDKISKALNELAKGWTNSDTAIERGIGIVKIVAGLKLIKQSQTLVTSAAGVMDSWADIFRHIGDAVGAWSGVLTNISELVKTYNRQVKIQSIKVIALSIAMLVGALYLLAKLDRDELIQGGIALGAILAGLVVALKVLTNAPVDDKIVKAYALAITAIGGSLMMIAMTAKILAGIEPGKLLKAGAALAAFIGMLGLASKAAASDWFSVAGFVGISLAVSLLVPAILTMSRMSFETLASGGAAIFAFVLLIGKAGALASRNKAGFLSFVGIATAVTTMVPAIVVLAAMPIEKSMKAALSLTVIMTALAGAVYIASSAMGEGKVWMVAALAAMVTGLTGALVVLALVPGAKLLKSVAALSTAMLMLAATTRLMQSSRQGLLLMTASISILIGAMYMLISVPTKKATSVLLSLSAFLLALSGAMFVLDKIPFAGAIGALAKMAIFVSGITAILGVFGYVVGKIKGLESAIKEADKILTLIGALIGHVVGSLVGGFMDAASSGLEAVGTHLSNFMTNLQPFLEGARMIDAEIVSGIKNLAEAALLLTGASLLNSLGSLPGLVSRIFSGGKSPISQLADNLMEFATKMILLAAIPLPEGWSEKIKDIAQCMKALGEAAEAVPTTGGVKGFLTGVHDLSGFAIQLILFGGSLKSLDNLELGKGWKKKIESIADVLTDLAEAADKIPKNMSHDSIASVVTGVKSLTDFASQLEEAAPKLVDFVSAINKSKSPINADTLAPVNAVADTIQELAEAADKIPKNLTHDSIASVLTGIKSIPDLVDGFKSVAKALPDFISQSKGLDKTKAERIKLMADIIEDMAKASAKIAAINIGKGIGESTRKMIDNLSSFTSKMKDYVPGFKEFAKEASTITKGEMDKAATVADGLNKVAGAAKKVKDAKGGGNPEDIKETFKALAAGLTAYDKAVKEIDSDELASKSAEIASSVKAVTKQLNKKTDTKSSAAKSVSQYVSGLKSGGAVKDAASAAAAIRKAATDALKKTESFKSAGTKCANAFAAGLKSTSKASANGKSLGNAGAKGAKDADFKGAGTSGASGFASGLRDSGAVQDVASAGTALGEAALKAAKKALKSKSPSRKFMELGHFGALGLAIGLKEYANKVYQAGQKIGIAGLDGSKQAMSDIDTALTDPRIKPVIDLSNVQRGADRINSILNNSARINAPMIDASIQRQNGGQMAEMIDKLATIVQTSSEQPSGDTVNIGDVTLDVSKLEDVATIEDFVNILTTAKSIA